MNMRDIITVVEANVPFDTGFMYKNGVRYSDNPNAFVITYDGNVVPYLPYQEYGFTHYKSGQFIKVNQYFIQNNTVNDLSYLINTAGTSEQSRIMQYHRNTTNARASMTSQGNLTSLTGHKVR
jgi:hypothetical protein